MRGLLRTAYVRRITVQYLTVLLYDGNAAHLYEANVRSSFSTDSTIELRLKMKAKKNIWRNEDQARAMAMAMHSIG